MAIKLHVVLCHTRVTDTLMWKYSLASKIEINITTKGVKL